MSETAARLGIMTAMQAAVTAHTGYTLVVEPDNRTLVDQVLQTNPYVQIQIEFMGAQQADMADRPVVKQVGQILMSTVVKTGSGEAAGAALRDFLVPYFDMKNLGIVHTHAAQVFPSKVMGGWEYTPVLVDFWYHRVST